MTPPTFDKNFGLPGKTALITGGASGIGFAIADFFAEKGANLILVDRNPAVVEIAATLARRGTGTLGLVADITGRPAVEQFVADGIARFGAIDILVNNAGVGKLQPAESTTDENWDLTMDINLKAPFRISQVVGRHMLARRSGRIVNIASQAALIALPDHLVYSASKAALVSMTQTLASEWGPHGITVNAISPTVVLTELGRIAWGGEAGERLRQAIPTGRFAAPEEIAAAAAFLASDASGMINGANLVVDGGYTIR